MDVIGREPDREAAVDFPLVGPGQGLDLLREVLGMRH